MEKLCVDILRGLNEGHVYDMGCVWLQYVKSCSVANVTVPQKYQTRRNSFYDDVKEILGDQAGFVRRIDQFAHLFIYPRKKSQLALAQQLTTANEDDGNIIVPLQDNITQQLVHSALHIKNELEKTEGHNSGWGGTDDDHVRKIIPESLYLFISIILGGTYVLDSDENTLTGKLHNNVCSIAQDIVYLASGNKKLTPKHVGLGLTLHQATRSEKLVDLFHAAGHTVGMDTIRRIDTTIATDILDRCEKNGNVYIPYEIAPYSPGRVILASCDNIDVLEETVDGKNTFHCTHMML